MLQSYYRNRRASQPATLARRSLIINNLSGVIRSVQRRRCKRRHVMETNAALNQDKGISAIYRLSLRTRLASIDNQMGMRYSHLKR